jgi:hypothetical protein
MKRHHVAAIFLAAGLAMSALAAEKSPVIGASPSKVPAKAAAKKKPAAEKPTKVAQAKKPGSSAKSRFKTTPRMRGYGG